MRFLGASLLLAMAVVLTGADSRVQELQADLDEIVGEFVERNSIPGLAVGVVKEGEVVYTGGFGLADPKTGRKVTADSLFHLASVSKTFTATAIMQLAEKGNLDLDAPVVTYLPYFQLDDERAREITIRQMLSHTSGMPDVQDYGWEKPEADEGALERYVKSLADRKLILPPGKMFAYSNMAYEVLGDVVSKVSGMTFEAYVRKYILEPLEMKSSTLLKEETDEGLRTTPHVGRAEAVVSDVYPYHRAHAPSSTMHSSAKEMCNWILANAQRGKFQDRRILKQETVDQMWTPGVPIGPRRTIGLCWMLGESPYGPTRFHTGRDVGFRSFLTILPEHQGGLVILTNYSEVRFRDLADEIMDLAFDGAE